jgi:uncharacterized protein (TIGR04255 family)
MLEALPPPDDAVLARPSATVVVFSLGIEEERDLKPADGIGWQKALALHGYATGTLQKVFQRNINVQTLLLQGVAAAPPAISSRDGWQAGYRGKPSQAALYRDGVTLERLEYPGFTEFKKEIRSVCTALRDVLHPSLRTRLSLRYSNALSSEQATTAEFWSDKVERSFLSVAADARLRPSMARSFSVTDFNDDEVTLQVRSGVQPDAAIPGNVAFVFDIDLSHLGLTPFDIDSSMDDVALLNRYARQMFQAIITPDYYAEMKAGAHA